MVRLEQFAQSYCIARSEHFAETYCKRSYLGRRASRGQEKLTINTLDDPGPGVSNFDFGLQLSLVARRVDIEGRGDRSLCVR